MEFGDNLKLLRQRKGLTQDEVAKAVGVTRKTYASWERGVAPRKDVYKKLAEVLECDTRDLFHYGDNAEVEIKNGAVFGAVGAGAAAAFALIGGAGPLGIAGSLLYGMVKGLSAAPKKITVPSTSREVFENDEDPSAIVVEQVQEMANDYERHQKQFQALSLGLLFQALASKGVMFRPPASSSGAGEPNNEAAVEIGLNNEQFKSWKLLFYAMDTKLSEEMPLPAATKAEVLLAQLISLAPKKDMKTSIVIDEEEVYNELRSYKGRNSYRGYLSVILVNIEEVKIAGEEYLSVYDDQEDWDSLPSIV